NHLALARIPGLSSQSLGGMATRSNLAKRRMEARGLSGAQRSRQVFRGNIAVEKRLQLTNKGHLAPSSRADMCSPRCY
ncbi:hypothetical protein KUCAC02_001703, partial [Chaenocephalus aceratus]